MRKSNAPSVRASTSLPRNIQSSNNFGSVSCEDSKKIQPNELYKENTCFKVVWNRRNSKKHKTWEGDGILKIINKNAILKDSDGSLLSSCSSFCIEEMENKCRFIIGNKEVEIIEVLKKSNFSDESISKENTKHKTDAKEKSRPFDIINPAYKKLKTTSNIKPKNDSVLPLIFTTPNLEHQSKFNKRKLPIVEVKVDSLVKHLRPHQRAGVVFLYECLLGIRISDYFGSILADDMGLGKTLQCLAICCTLLKSGPYGNEPIIKRVLIVTPSSLVDNWNKEISKWLAQERLFAYVVDSKNKPENYSKQKYMPFVIVSYEMLTKNCDEFNNLNFDLLICDEGHRLKNNNIKAAISLTQLNIKRKIVVTGTPIQNDLQEFYSLVDFVNPGILGKYEEYKQKYEIPIVQSQAPDASLETKEIGKERALDLTQITSKFFLRRTQQLNNKYLPKKEELIIFLKPSELQQLIIKKILEWYEEQKDFGLKDTNALQLITLLKKVCNHPSLIRTTKQQDSNLLKYVLKFLPKWSEMGPFDSSKLELVENMLKEIIENKEKIVLVSHHTSTLDMIEGLCQHYNYNFLRLDGSTPTNERGRIVKKFNVLTKDNPVFLLSSKAGGVGLNLSGASRLLLFDMDWNPAADEQAMSRIWRDGQKSNVKIYRLIIAGSIEEKIFQRQIAKTSLSGCIIDQLNNLSTMKFSQEELKDIFSIQEDYSICATHDLLDCNCNGDGMVIIEKENDGENLLVDISPYHMDFMTALEQKSILKVNELKYWEHYKYPIKTDILQDTYLQNSADNIIFIFRSLNCQQS